MKIVAKPIEMIFRTTENGAIRPLRFKLQHDDDAKIVAVDQIIKVEKTLRAGKAAYVFTCQSTVEGVALLYELRYALDDCKWVLYKI